MNQQNPGPTIWQPVEQAANKTLFSGLGVWLLIELLATPDWAGIWPLWVFVFTLGYAFLRSAIDLVSEHVKWVNFRRYYRDVSAPPQPTEKPWERDNARPRDQGW